jgi:hypothetical protein
MFRGEHGPSAHPHEEKGVGPMADELKAYKVEVNGTETTVLLSDADAERRGLSDKDLASKASSASNKSRTASNK